MLLLLYDFVKAVLCATRLYLDLGEAGVRVDLECCESIRNRSGCQVSGFRRGRGTSASLCLGAVGIASSRLTTSL